MSYFRIRTAFVLFSAGIIVACGGSSTETADAGGSTSPAIRTTVETPELTPVERGSVLYKRCRACHTLGEGERHKVGPNLWGVFGRTAGTREDFNYSKAMLASEVVWDDETLAAYIEKPNSYMPGNRMSFVGIKNADDQAALIAYLRQETGG